MRHFKITALILLLLLVAIQFIRPEQNNKNNPSGIDITQIMNVPDSVQLILKTACYDCHSNHARYPWYANIQPIGWVLASHIKEGKSNLNFDEFGNYSPRRQRSKLFAIKNSIKDETMPLLSYQLIHKNARLTKNQKKTLLNWASNASD